MPICLMSSGPGERALPFRDLPVLLQGRSPAIVSAPPPSNPTSLLADVLDAFSDAVVLADRSARVLYMNRSARGLVSRGVIAIRSGILCANSLAETRKLQALIGGNGQDCEESAHLKAGSHLFVSIATLGSASGAVSDHVAIVHLRNLETAQPPSLQSIMAYFGLTPAEARLAQEIIKGDGLARCAKRLGTRVTTVRSHLKHIFEKTGTNRQATLVRLLLTCGSGIAARGSLDQSGEEPLRARPRAGR